MINPKSDMSQETWPNQLITWFEGLVEKFVLWWLPGINLTVEPKTKISGEKERDLSGLSKQELAVLEQKILAERSRRMIGNPNVIVVEPDAPIEAHQKAIEKLITRQQSSTIHKRNSEQESC
jgi:hypothetical protein